VVLYLLFCYAVQCFYSRYQLNLFFALSSSSNSDPAQTKETFALAPPDGAPAIAAIRRSGPCKVAPDLRPLPRD